MLSDKRKNLFLNLIRIGIGNEFPAAEVRTANPTPEDWNAIKALANEHGLLAVVLDGADKVQEISPSIPVTMKLEWIGEVLQNYETRYKQYEKAIYSLAKFYNEHGFKMMVLKGYACSLDWPNPKHRPCGDIDIWQFGDYRLADAALVSEKSIKVDASHHHHTVFDWDGFMVENHYDFINVHHHKSNAKFEKILKELGRDDSHYLEVNGEKVYLPSPNLHALFLLKHIMMHFAAEGIMLRQLLDWGFFIEKHWKDVDWEWLEGVLKQYGMMDLYNVLNAICVGNLGFDVKMFLKVQFVPELKEKVLDEILKPQYGSELPQGFLNRVVFKLKRWRANAWKHKLCYTDSMWSAFWSGVWNHLLKPSSI